MYVYVMCLGNSIRWLRSNFSTPPQLNIAPSVPTISLLKYQWQEIPCPMDPWPLSEKVQKKSLQIKVNYTLVPLPFRRYDWRIHREG